ncbi:MAG: leucine-rich repeat protein [Lachnospiraceae bacterium]|nr:leucine-rich repeat protein [Lachnospiraceae bacterium]
MYSYLYKRNESTSGYSQLTYSNAGRMSYLLEKGVTYYYRTYFSSSSYTGDYSVRIVKATEMEEESVYETSIETAGDFRWFSFTPESTNVYTMYSTSEDGYSTYVYLYKANDSGNGYSQITYSSGSSLSYRLESGVTYYFMTKFYYSSSTYVGDISVRLTEASEIESGSEYEASIDTANEYRWFAFTPSATNVYQASAAAEDGSSMYVYLYDSSLSQITYASGSSLYWMLEGGNTYYYKVYFTSSSSTGSFSLTVSPTSMTVLEDGGEYEVAIDSAGDSYWFSYTPEETGVYVISSSGDYDTYVYLYEGEVTSYISSDDDSGDSTNFSLQYLLQGGTTYYYRTKFLSSSITGSFTVQFENVLDVESIVISSYPRQDYYAFLSNSSLVYTGLALDITYADGTVETLAYGSSSNGRSIEITEPEDLYDEETGLLASGEHTITVSFAGFSAEYTVQVVETADDVTDVLEDGVVKEGSGLSSQKSCWLFTPETDGYYTVSLCSSYGYNSYVSVADEEGNALSAAYYYDYYYKDTSSWYTRDYVYEMAANVTYTIVGYVYSSAGYSYRVQAEKIAEISADGASVSAVESPRVNALFTVEEAGVYEIVSVSDISSISHWGIIRLSEEGSYATHMYGNTVDGYHFGNCAYMEPGQYLLYTTYSSLNEIELSVTTMQSVSVPGAEFEVTESSEYLYEAYLITASETGDYAIWMQSSSDTPYVYLYDAESMSSVSTVNNADSQSDDSGTIYNRKLNVYLEEGESCLLLTYAKDVLSLSVDLMEAYEVPAAEFELETVDVYQYETSLITASETASYLVRLESSYSTPTITLRDAQTLSTISGVSASFTSTTEDSETVYAKTFTVDLEEGESYLLTTYGRGLVSLTVKEDSIVESIELVTKPYQTVFYEKLDFVSSSTTLGTGSQLTVTYTDGTQETLTYGSRSSKTSQYFYITLPEDTVYDSTGYLGVGTYYANVTYIDKTITLPISVKTVTSMPSITLDENGEGSYSGELTDLSSKTHYGYLRFRSTEDGFYNLTLSSSTAVSLYYSNIYNLSYNSMSYSTTSSTSDTLRMQDTSIYVKKGQSCYIRYYYYTSSSDADDAFTLSVNLDADQSIEALECGVQAEATNASTSASSWFSFTPEEDGTYYLSTQSATTSMRPVMYRYTSPDATTYTQYTYLSTYSSHYGYYYGSYNHKNLLMSVSMTAGTTYYFRLSNYTGTLGVTIVEAATPESIELLTEEDIYCNTLNTSSLYENFADLRFLITYSDGTSEEMTYGFTLGSYSGVTKNTHNYSLSYTEPSWNYDEDNLIVEGSYMVTFKCGDATVEVPIYAYSLQEMSELPDDISVTISSGGNQYYKFTAETTGYYMFTASSTSTYPTLGMYEATYMTSLSYEYGDAYLEDAVYNQVKIYSLTEGEEYCLRIGNSASYSINVTCVSELLPAVASVEISQTPQTVYYTGVDSVYSTDGLEIIVTYESEESDESSGSEEGTASAASDDSEESAETEAETVTETILAGERSEKTHLLIETQLSGNDDGDMSIGEAGTKTINVSFMNGTASYEITVNDISDLTDLSGELASANESIYAKLVPDTTGYYQVGLTADEGVTPVIDSILNSSYSDVSMHMSETDGDAGTSQTLVYLLAGKTYYLKGHLEQDGERVAGSYAASLTALYDLKDGVEAGTLAAEDTGYFQLSAESTGYYRFILDADSTVSLKVYDNSYNGLTLQTGTADTSRRYYLVRLTGGNIYLVTLTSKSEEKQDYTLYATKESDVKSLTLVQEPDQLIYYSPFDEIDGTGLELLVTYTNGTTEQISYGEKSKYGNVITLDTSAVEVDEDGTYVAGTYTVSAEFSEASVSFEIEIRSFDIEDAASLTAEETISVEIPADTSEFYVFTPTEDGTYVFSTNSETTLIISIYAYDEDSGEYTAVEAADSDGMSLTAVLTADTTYIIRLENTSSEDAANTGIRMHDTSKYTAVTGVTISEDEIVFGELEETQTLTATVLPVDADDVSVTWSSSDTSVAVVDETGKVTAVAEGVAVITVTTNDGGYTDTCTAVVDTEAPSIDSVYPADGSIFGPASHTLWVYASDTYGIDYVNVEYAASLDGEYTLLKCVNEDGSSSAVVSAVIPLDEFENGDTIYVQLTAVDKGGAESDPMTLTYTVDKEAPQISDLAGVYNQDTQAIDLSWKKLVAEGAEDDTASYGVYRKAKDADDSTYQYIGTVTAYSNEDDYSCSDRTVDSSVVTDYTYKITVNDKRGNSRSYEHDASTEYINLAPEIVMEYSAVMYSGQEGTFDLSGCTDDQDAIVSYEINYGDDSESDSAESAENAVFTHTYTLDDETEEATYTVTVTVTDSEDLSDTETFTIRVVNLNGAGMATIYVVDEDGMPITDAPVYFNMGEETQVVSSTDRKGAAEFTDVPGSYAVGVYLDGYLPAKTTIQLEADTTTEYTFILTEQDLVSASVTARDLSWSEIDELGLASDEDNYHVVEYDVTLTYGTKITFYYDGSEISGDLTGDGVVYVPQVISDDIVVILEIPVTVSFLKEFYDVKLYIVNNSSEEFYLTDNTMTLNILDADGEAVEGLTILESGETYSGQEASVASIQGQSSATVQWLLRGDKAGEYYLSVDYSGILSEFNVPVSATFEADSALKVYGTENLSVTMQIPDSFTDATFFYNLIMENTGSTEDGDKDMYLPGMSAGGELVQTMYYKQGETDPTYIAEMPLVLRTEESIEQFYIITDQVREQLSQYENYEDFVLYFRSACVEALSEYDVELKIEVLPASELLAKYEAYRADVATDFTYTIEGAEYGNTDTAITASATAPTNSENYSLSYVWYNADLKQIGTGAELNVTGCEVGDTYVFYCVVISTRTDNGNKAQTAYNRVEVEVTPKTVELVWSGADTREYDGLASNVTATLTGLISGDTCEVTVEGGTESAVGTHTATAVSLSNENYQLPEDVTIDYTIEQRTVELEWTGTEEREYDGTASNVQAAVANLVTVDGVEEECTVTVSGGTETDAGTWTATATELTGADSGNYRLPETDASDSDETEEGTASDDSGTTESEESGESSTETEETESSADARSTTYTILPRTVELTWSGTDTRTYDGTASELTSEVSNLVEGDECNVTVTDCDAIDAGTWTATATGLTGEDSGNYQLPDTDSIESTISATYTILPLTVELSWSGTDTRTYDGTASEVKAAVTNLKTREDTNTVDTCTVTVDNGDAIDAGDYTATATALDNANYTLPDTTVEGNEDAASVDYTIEQLEAVLGWSGTEEREYDGTASAVTATVTNVVTRTDTETVDTCTVTVTDGDAIDAGEHTATAASLDNANYKLPDAATTTYTITPKPIEITWSGYEDLTYSGEAVNVTAAVDETGLVTREDTNEVDTCTVTVTGGDETNAGTYTAEAVLSNGNYQIADTSGSSIEYTIAKKTVTLEWSGTDERTYDGTASAVTAAVSADNLVGEDTCTVTVTDGTETDAGTYTATATELSNENYQLPAAVTTTYTIEQLEAVLSWSGMDTRTYDGTASNVQATVTNLVTADETADECTVTVSGGTQANAGTHTATAAALSNNNYKLPDEASVSYTIAQLEAELVWTGTEKTYDGNAAAVAATVSNLVEGDTCEVSVSGGNEINAGSYTATAAELTGDGAGNYALPADPTTEYTILQKTVALEWANTETRTYNGEASEVTASVTEDSLADGDTLTVTVTNGDNVNAGTYIAEATALADVDDADVAKNYALPSEATQEYTIVPIEVSLTWTGAVDKTYDGSAPEVAAEIADADDILDADAQTCTVTLSGDEVSADAGTYTLTAALGNDNYEITEATASVTFTISPKTVSLTWSGTDTRTYDGTASNVTAQVNEGDLIGSDSCTVTVTGGDATDAGTHTATATALSNANYQLPSDVTVAYVIDMAELAQEDVSVEVTIGELTYTGDALTPAITVTSADGTTTFTEGTDYTVSYSNNTEVGTATITVTFTGNFSGTATSTFTITEAETEDSGSSTETEDSGSSTETENSGSDTGTEGSGSGTGTEGTDGTGTGTTEGSGTEGTDGTDGTGTGSTDGTVGTGTETNGTDGTGASVGTVYTDDTAEYTVTASGTSGSSENTVTVTGPASKNATSVSIPASVTINGVDYKVTTIGESAFANCTNLETVSVGGSLTVIEAKAFYKCTNLKSVSGCSEVVSIGASAFSGCKKLTSVDGMTKLTTISSKAFYNCSKLTTIGSKKSAITLASIVTIGSKAFYNCKAVKKANLTSKALKSIGTSAFQKCTAMKSFTSKSTVLKTIGKKAFYGDKKLAKVTLKTKKLTKSSVKANAFKGIKSTCTFRVPSSKVSSYKSIFKARGASKSIKVKK